MKVLVLGVTGMLGSCLYKYLSQDDKLDVWGGCRAKTDLSFLDDKLKSKVLSKLDVNDVDSLVEIFADIDPDVVINCIGIIKQSSIANDPLKVLPVNALLPHRLNQICKLNSCRLVHISTDCVFAGRQGMYKETDDADASDLYGRSKHIGEVSDSPNAVTLRTSIIGHELSSNLSLVDWFLSQDNSVKGFSKAVFSGLPTIELSRLIKEFVLPDDSLAGLYHVSAEPINKFELLKIISGIYKKDIEILESKKLDIDRSLNSERFREETGYKPPTWGYLVEQMYQEYMRRD